MNCIVRVLAGQPWQISKFEIVDVVLNNRPARDEYPDNSNVREPVRQHS